MDSKKSSVTEKKEEVKKIAKIKTVKEKKVYFLSVKIRDKILLAKHLSVMLEAGIPLREALETLHEQTDSKSLKYILGIAVKDLSGGQVLAFSLNKFQKIFDPFFVNLVKVGETSGTLQSTLKYLAAQLEKTQDLQGKVRNALLYPAIVFCGALGVGIYLGFFMLPQLLPLFSSMDLKLPFTTRMLLAGANGFSTYWPFILAFLIVISVVFVFLFRIEKIKIIVHGFFIRLPILGRLFREIQVMQFSRVFGILLLSGIKIVPALKITADSLTNLVYKREINRIADLIERGEAVGGQLCKLKLLFTKTSANMVVIGERTGRLSESLTALADFSDREIDTMTRNLSTMIEPFVLMLVGIMVGFVALSVITPIYQLTQSFSG
ncbi:hypothetical protein A2316_02415 [Candidatus Falkowbacteria bacterium RIFOXYB2_FULL_38_15]|uniref:Type II secretion system protein GspF domain-containing protein n=1 Tax=Candidatus Falkowbacteria bacterium RIFOXYA2_FULL_38_12 TaxID=1797993 RepID=A0A1F5S1I4_9BACT|nr:MAG: hypothetical protein A2257_04180 [Candidatus Falkowbacteria bacterium RIFOXYA2_FULL_38_12]OGF33639.1 MAG: hypothetical protein A2316_02415 [Candidatus Falkowbacteria bacterium RIFOXYB2_FULL_38_15]OGF42308.1 MAG: hypothetical protein A2555_02290 [Candidatus Falkowbacteria bacterium RIFOXYD2_FULL_39_16]